MQKELDMDLQVRVTQSQYEALKAVAEASGDTYDEWLHTCVIQGIESDIELYYSHSKTRVVFLFVFVQNSAFTIYCYTTLIASQSFGSRIISSA